MYSFALERGLTRELVYALELSMNEVLTNIISYAYCDDTPHEIVVELFAQPDRIRVEIEDDGVPFNPLALLVEEPAQSLEQARATGRGIPLMRNLMDELDYARRGNNNVLTMAMQIKPAKTVLSTENGDLR